MTQETPATASSEEEWEFIPDPPPPETEWKNEVSSRLEKYRARRGTRRPRYEGSMSLDFERAANRMIGNTAVADEPESDSEREGDGDHAIDTHPYPAMMAGPVPTTEEMPVWGPEPQREPQRDPLLDPQPNRDLPMRTQPHPAWNPQPDARLAQTKLIEFPRLPTLFDMAPTGFELAEAVVDKPRILYVPEEVPTSEAPLKGIELEAEEEPVVREFELPLAVAPMGLRVFAALVDTLMVVLAAGMFLMIVLRDVPAPENKAGYALVFALPCLLWAIYQYLFLVHCGETPGMQMAHVGIASFDNEPVGRRTRRARALACMVSTFPLGLGLIWALLDDDTLCWHDRITRTYVAQIAATELSSTQ